MRRRLWVMAAVAVSCAGSSSSSPAEPVSASFEPEAERSRRPAPSTAPSTGTAAAPEAGPGTGQRNRPEAASPAAPAGTSEPRAEAKAKATAQIPTNAPKPVPESNPRPDMGKPVPRLPAPERVLIVGDSMIVTELGRDLERRLAQAFGARVTRRGKSSTGLARPDFFDWFEEGARLAQATRPDLVVIVVGGNDGQDLVDAQGRGRIHWRTPEWETAYAERVHRFLDAMAAPGRRFVWLGLPAMEHRRLEGKLELIRRVQSEALAERSDVLAVVEHERCYLDRNGRILTQVPTGPGQGRPMRQDDGIHLSLAGARFASRCTAPQVLRRFAASRDGTLSDRR